MNKGIFDAYYREMDPNLVGGHVMAGYQTVRSLTDLELDVLPILVAARWTQSLVMGEQAYNQDPTNEYVLATAQAGGWETFQNFWTKPRSDLMAMWSKVIQTYD